ncbi:MAG TPA: MoxR family ATPase [Fibrobacteria bacterium]|nr:MoxR family ATPase [Fibrobacteria bacterium]
MDVTPEEMKSLLAEARREVRKIIIGQEEVIDLCLVTLLAGQHALLEGVPGVAKTLLVRTLALVLGCEFGRIQFTPDLMPSDITGTNIFNLKKQEFELIRGPIFTSFLLADEINRAPAKTQSALLQAMQERHVTIDRGTYALDAGFTVFATQNPVEHEGTYPLPEAQKDRFLIKITMGYPAKEDEEELARRTLGDDAPSQAVERGGLRRLVPPEALGAFRRALQSITVKPELLAYGVELVRKTREHESILVGGGPRATQSLLLAARAFAAVEGRDFVTPDDIRHLALPVLEHRIAMRPEFEIEGLRVEDVIKDILQGAAVPR